MAMRVKVVAMADKQLPFAADPVANHFPALGAITGFPNRAPVR